MKKTVLLSFTFLYLMLSSGIAINVNYCGSKISSINFIFKAKEKCGCKTKPSKSCCKSNSHFVKLNDNHQPNSVEKVSGSALQHFAVLNPIAFIACNNKKNSLYKSYSFRPHNQPIHLLNSVFII